MKIPGSAALVLVVAGAPQGGTGFTVNTAGLRKAGVGGVRNAGNMRMAGENILAHVCMCTERRANNLQPHSQEQTSRRSLLGQFESVACFRRILPSPWNLPCRAQCRAREASKVRSFVLELQQQFPPHLVALMFFGLSLSCVTHLLRPCSRSMGVVHTFGTAQSVPSRQKGERAMKNMWRCPTRSLR